MRSKEFQLKLLGRRRKGGPKHQREETPVLGGAGLDCCGLSHLADSDKADSPN